MAFRHGKNTKVLVNAFDLSSYFNDVTVAASVETAETTTFGATGNSKTYVTGLNDATVTTSGLFDGATGAIDETIGTILSSDADVNFTIAQDGGMTLGARCVSGQAIETKYDITSPVSDVVSLSCDFQVDAEASRAVILAPLSTVSATGTSTSVDNGAATSNGGTAVLHVPANTRNGTIGVKIQHSSDNSTFVDLVTFTTVSTATTTSERIVVAVATTVNRYLRMSYTVAGSTGSATIAATFGRRN
jgi:hypothetical protein